MLCPVGCSQQRNGTFLHFSYNFLNTFPKIFGIIAVDIVRAEVRMEDITPQRMTEEKDRMQNDKNFDCRR